MCSSEQILVPDKFISTLFERICQYFLPKNNVNIDNCVLCIKGHVERRGGGKNPSLSCLTYSTLYSIIHINFS